MRFSIIIPTYNRIVSLGRCITAIKKLDWPKDQYEIIVVDDGSVDGTKDMISRLSGIRYFRIDHKGQSVARNIGIDEAKGEIVVFTDDDCVVERSWLKKINSKFEIYDVDAVGGTILNPHDGYIAWSSHLLQFSTWLPCADDRMITNIPTANIAYYKKSIQDIRFDEHLGSAGYEDSLLNYNLMKKHGKILFSSDISVMHHAWDNPTLRRFFEIQRRTAIGFLKGGYKVHEKKGELLMRFKLLNLLCFNLIYVLLRTIRCGYLLRFIYHFPLMLAGELYKGCIIIRGIKKKYR